jgi:hypothetical protein
MPLPRESERAANEVARILAALDERAVEYVVDGRPLPSARSVLADLRVHVAVSVTAAMREADPDITVQDIREAVDVQMAALQRAIAGVLDDARRLRRRIPRVVEQEDGEPVAAFIRRVGKFAALGALLAARGRRRPPQDIARQVGVRLPRRTAGYGRMVVRTESAIARNTHTAKVVERKRADADRDMYRVGDWCVYVRDALKGPTDADCEAVDRKYATPEWIRNHPVEHPNCTRQGRPVRLPAGAAVTLLD